MGLVRLDGYTRSSSSNGNSPVTSSSYTPSTPTRPKTFQEALNQAQTASDAAAGSKDPNVITTAAIDWAIVQDMEENEYRLAAASSDPAGQTAALDAKYGKLFRGHGDQTEFYDSTWKQAKAIVQKESPAERQYQIQFYNAQTKVQDTYKTLQSASTDAEKSAAYTAYSGAVTDQINLQLNHALAGMPAGPGGSHTLEQWKQAAQKVKEEAGATDPDSAQVIDSIALVSGYLDQIEHNPGSLKLTPTEQALAKKDPVTLAFVKAAGVTLDPDAPGLSPLMKDLVKRDPVMFAMLTVGKINVYTDETPVLKNTPVGQLTKGEYLHVTVNGTPLHDHNFINQLAQIYQQADNEHRADAIAAGLLPTLNIQGNTQIQALMMAADNARMQWAPAAMKDQMAGSKPDMKGALSFLNTQLNGFFNPGDRAAFWESSGKPYFTHDYFRNEFKALMRKPDQSDENYHRDMTSTELNADKVGKYVQEILKDAPKEVAGVVLDTVMSSFDKNWYHSNNVDMSGASPRFEDFYKGLSLAVELNPDRAKDVVDWLTDRDGVQAGVLTGLWDPGLRHFEGLKDTMVDGFGTLLSKTLNEKVQDSSDFQNMAWDMKIRYDQGDKKVQENYIKKINNQAYTEFSNNPDKVLMPFFKSFLGDPMIGKPVDFKNDTQLRNMAGKALGLVPANTEAASAKDYSTEWYTEGTAEWNKIQLVVNWIHDKGGDTPNITALPFKYASKRDGLQTGALFLINKPGDDTPDVIDGAAALDAVDMNQGKTVNAKDVNVQWHYDDYQNFRDHNHYDTDGYIYLPTNMILDADRDGKITSQDYYGEKAAIETGWEKTEKYGLFALTAVGAVVTVFVPPVGGAILAGTGVLGAIDGGYQLYKMSSHGASISFDNSQAQAYWLNISANLLAFGRLGILSKFGPAPGGTAMFMRGSAAVMGKTAGFIGMTQIAHQAGFLLNSIGDPNVKWFDKVNAFAGIVSAAAMVRLAGARVKPGADIGEGVPRGRYITVTTTRGQQQGLAATTENPPPGAGQTAQSGEPGFTVKMSPARGKLLAEAKGARSDRVITTAQLAVQRTFGKWIGTKPSTAPIRLDDAQFDPIAARLAPGHPPREIVGVYDTKTGQIYLRNRGDNYLDAVSGIIAGHEYVHAVGSPFFYPAIHDLVVRGTGDKLIEGITQYLTFKALGPEKYTQQPGGYGKYLQALHQGRNVESTWAQTYTIETVVAERIFARLGDTAYRAYFRGGFKDTEAFKKVALQDALVVQGARGSQSGLPVRTAGSRFNPLGNVIRTPIDKYGSTAMVGKPRQTTFAAFKLWGKGGAPKAGLTSAVWSDAGRPSFKAWDEAGRPTDSWWTGAYAKYQTDINNEATARHAADTGTTLNWNDAKYIKPAEQSFAGQIGVEAYARWVDAGGRRGTGKAPAYWTEGRAGRVFNNTIRGTAYRTWRAEQGFAADLSKGFAGHRAAGKAGLPEDPWWTQAKTNLRTDIDAAAKEVFKGDQNPAVGAHWSDAKYIKAGEDALSMPLSVEAYRIWNEGIPSKGVPARQDATSTGTRPWYTYQGWVKANKPARSTTIGQEPGRLVRGANKLLGRPTTPKDVVVDDVVLAAAPPTRVFQIPGVRRLTNVFLPKKLTQEQVDRLGPWLTVQGRANPPVYTPAKYSPTAVSGPWWTPGALKTRTLNAGGHTRVALKQAPGLAWRGTGLKMAQLVSGERNRLTQTPTDRAAWSDAEVMFKARLGSTWYKTWVKLGRPVGLEDQYFRGANEQFKAQIGAKALDYFENPDKLPTLTAGPRGGRTPWWASKLRFLDTSIDRGVAYSYWQTKTNIPLDVQALIKGAGDAWKNSAPLGNNGMPKRTQALTDRNALPYWHDALGDPAIQSQIKAQATTLAGSGRKMPFHTWQAQNVLSDVIAAKAYELWKADGSPAGSRFGTEWTTAQTKETELAQYTDVAFYDAWANKGAPEGWREMPFVKARDDVMADNAYGNRYAQFGQDAWHASGVYFRQMLARGTQRNGIFDSVGYRQHLWQTLGAMGSTLKWYGMAYAGTNLVGMIGWAGANEFTDAHRVTPMGSPQDELKAFLQNPNSYVANNYENYVFGIDVGDRGYQSDGHVMAFSGPDGMVYFQRVPHDLYEKLEEIATPAAAKPWLLDTGYQLGSPQVVKNQDGSISIYETIKAGDAGSFSIADLDPFEADPGKLPDVVKEQVGLRAYMQWVQAGRPMTSPAALLWSGAETKFQAKIAGAYDLWANAGRPSDPYWSKAAADYKGEVEKDQTLQKQAAQQGGTYTPDQYNQAEKRSGAKIAMRAYQYWTAPGSGKRDASTIGSDTWRSNEPGFQDAVAVPGYNAWAGELAFQDRTGFKAYDEWVLAGRPTTGANSHWQQALNHFKGQPGDEASHGGDIAMEAYTYWTLAGRNAQTAGADTWKGNEHAFTDVAQTTPLDQWQQLRGTPGNSAAGAWGQNDGIWHAAVTDWNNAGQPIMPLVQIRQPYKYEGNVDGDLPRSSARDENWLGTGYRERGAWAAGPIEGWRLHANWELAWNYRYNIPTATTFRIGGPSPTQGWNVDVRQQDTTIWSRAVLSIGSMEYNGAQVYDLTAGSRDGWSAMNTRLYVDVGNRNRTQIDGTDKFLRLRETGFVEIGVGADFFKLTSGDQSLNVNGYFELQFYPGDARAQVTRVTTDNSTRFPFTMGYQRFPSPIGIDPAFQITWTDSRIRLADYVGFSSLPLFNGEVR